MHTSIQRQSLPDIRQKYLKILKFGLVGAVGAMIGIGILYLFTDLVHLHYLISNAISFLAATAIGYYLNNVWVFKSRPLSLNNYLKYTGSRLLTLGIGEGLMYLFTSVFGVWYMLSSVMTILVNYLINYFICTKIIWRENT